MPYSGGGTGCNTRFRRRKSQKTKTENRIMKKIKFISAIALTLALASCEDFDLPNPPGQTNPEPAVFENSGINLAQGDANINLVQFNEANEDVNVANVTELVNFPADYTLSVDMEVAGNQNFDNSAVITTTLVDNAVMVNPDILNGAIQKAMTKAPGTYEVYARYIAYAVRDNTRVRLGGLDAYFAPDAKYTVTTLNPATVLEDAYYLVPCDAAGTPVFAKAIKMSNTVAGSSTYDNPEFAIKINVEEAEAASDTGYLWRLAAQSVVTAANAAETLGCNPADESALNGLLGASYPAGSIKLTGPVLVTVNVETRAYSINYALENLWPLSGSTLNNAGSAMMLYTNDYITYNGVSFLNKKFIIAGQPNKAGSVVFRPSEEEPVLSEDTYTLSGTMVNAPSGTEQFDTPVLDGTTSKTAGLFWMNVNVVTNTYEVTYLQTLSVIGNANGWDLATAIPLTASKDYKTWTATDVEIDGDFKINANGAWAVGFSGTKVSDAMNELVYNVDKQDGGANLEAPQGKYDVTVDFSVKPYIVTLKKK